jgi:hypothetical protein
MFYGYLDIQPAAKLCVLCDFSEPFAVKAINVTYSLNNVTPECFYVTFSLKQVTVIG